MIQINGNDTPDVVVNQGFGFYPMDLCDFSGSYLIDPLKQSNDNSYQQSIDMANSHIDAVTIQHDILPSIPIPPSVFPQFTIKEVDKDQLLSQTFIPYNFDEFKNYAVFTQLEFCDIPPTYLTVADTDNPVRCLFDSNHDITQIMNSFLSIVLSANVQFDNKLDEYEESYKDGTVLFIGLKSASQVFSEYTIYHRGCTIDGTLQNDSTTEQFIYNTVKPRSEKNNWKHIHSLYENIHKYDTSACGTYVTMREIEETIKDQVSVPQTMPIRFRLSILLDDIFIFSRFTDYLNYLFGDHKIKFKINPNAFEFAQVNPIISMAKYYTMNKTDLMASGPDKLKNIDLLFRNWSLRYQYTKQFTQMGCTADLITKISIEQITDS
ncbi:MAG: hypothetical protein EZS28_038384 [Streblomastix strix]|uniref:Uncharacterized protein n=1 Tax=Streblomastix strix TaxID=222440 RepID=A0A5J4U6U2_9EUKA|nr:MAG: hypothetical protein EZS28_038384 [Streblomastix strix]